MRVQTRFSFQHLMNVPAPSCGLHRVHRTKPAARHGEPAHSRDQMENGIQQVANECFLVKRLLISELKNTQNAMCRRYNIPAALHIC
jgi:hypothetical protein